MNAYRFLLMSLACVGLIGCEQPKVNDASPDLANTGSAIEQPVTSTSNEEDVVTDAEWKECPEQRPEVCTQQFLPVCGRIDTGIRCVTSPCPSHTFKTFGNACTACASNDVIDYIDGACTDAETDTN